MTKQTKQKENTFFTWSKGLFSFPSISDINECEDSPSRCQANQRCVNQPGGYYCTCHQGYRLNRLTGTCLGY